MITTKKVIKVGASIGFIISQDVIKEKNLKAGDLIEINWDNVKIYKTKHILIEPSTEENITNEEI